MKRAALLTALAVAVLSPVVVTATVISATEAVGDWERVVDPVRNRDLDVWDVDGANIIYPSTQGQGLVSDFDVSGDFSFTARLFTPHTTGARFGLFFGYSDNAHHYRVSFGGPSVPGLPEHDGSFGLSLVKKNGFAAGSTLTLFNESALFFAQDTDYDVTVSRVGDRVGLDLLRVVDGSLLATASVTDTTFVTGKIGIWTSSVNSTYSQLDLRTGSGPAPEPASLLLFLLGGFGFFCTRDRELKSLRGRRERTRRREWRWLPMACWWNGRGSPAAEPRRRWSDAPVDDTGTGSQHASRGRVAASRAQTRCHEASQTGARRQSTGHHRRRGDSPRCADGGRASNG